MENLENVIKALIPTASFEKDNEDQLVIYTGLYSDGRLGWEPSKAEEIYQDFAIFISDELVQPGWLYFMNDQATVGWYCVRSTDPSKQDLFLPQHIFRKCFRWIKEDHGHHPKFWQPVREL